MISCCFAAKLPEYRDDRAILKRLYITALFFYRMALLFLVLCYSKNSDSIIF
ncbi:hypothetical protein Barb4_00812 [Bacteroidales bacterium Barb4]|nr:hypothetical protein Barb4_00812 [Bacteroidales bacterium Barb4]